MSERCRATTKAGARCRNQAQTGSPYCYVHRHAGPVEKAAGAMAAEAGDTPQAPVSRAQFEAMMIQVNELARMLRERVPDYAPPPYSPQELLNLLRQNLHRFTPEMRLDVLRELQEGLRGPRARDLLDLETWKGLWFILNYTVESESRSLFKGVSRRLAALPGAQLVTSLPGAGVVTELAGMLEGSRPKDFLDPDTWKGMAYILQYSLQYEAGQLKQRLIGQEGATDQDDSS